MIDFDNFQVPINHVKNKYTKTHLLSRVTYLGVALLIQKVKQDLNKTDKTSIPINTLYGTV